MLALVTAPALAAPWEPVTDTTIGAVQEWSNKVELADIDGDGRIDILFANGGDYASPGIPTRNQVFRNPGSLDAPWPEVTDQVFQDATGLTRALKVADFNQDGIVDIVVAGAYQTQSRMWLGTGGGAFTESTSQLPQVLTSAGDMKVGDVDADGDLDLALIDWGTENPLSGPGGPLHLWLNDGDATFVAADDQVPALTVGMSWDLELVDVDNDWDLDVAISCKSCEGSRLLRNDGTGNFVDVSADMPAYPNNYEFAPGDMNGDGFVDLITINDGPGLTEHIFLNDGAGGFVDATDTLWPPSANVGVDDNVAVLLDYESDGDLDVVIGALGFSSDRLLRNDGTGALTLDDDLFPGGDTPGTLGLAVAHLDNDDRVDMVQSQGELADDNHVYRGVDVPPDTAAPAIPSAAAITVDGGAPHILARIHDFKTPVQPDDFQSILVSWEIDGGFIQGSMRWVGGSLWRAEGAPEDAPFEICARDRAGNQTCESFGDDGDDGGETGRRRNR